MLIQTKEGNQTQQVLDFTLITCCSCGLPFMAPELTRQIWRRNKDTFYCPNGHPMSYEKSTHEIEKEKLRSQLEDRGAELQRRTDQLLDEMNKKNEAERKLRRIQKGVCSCCNRSFSNLAAHMKTKHPEAKEPEPAKKRGRPRKHR